jgi:integrative and conjugative element protein (TIGR02256 family)
MCSENIIFAASPVIFLSNQSYRDILNETSQNLATETGGVLIGECRQNKWFVVESIDPGPKAILQSSYFEYDQAYVNHLCNKVKRRYVAQLRLLGLWHRHPGSFDSFSGTDDATHRRYLQQCNGSIISGLVNIDPTFRINFYIVNGEPPRHQKTPSVVGDQHFPPELLQLIDHYTLIDRIHNAPQLRPKPVQKIQILNKHESSPSIMDSIANPIRDLFDAKIQPTTSPNTSEVESATSPVATGALEMLEEELEYLDSQSDFEYELEMSTQGVLLTMQMVSRIKWALGNKKRIRFLFTVEDDKRVVKHGNHTYPFRKGIIEEFIGRAFY